MYLRQQQQRQRQQALRPGDCREQQQQQPPPPWLDLHWAVQGACVAVGGGAGRWDSMAATCSRGDSEAGALCLLVHNTPSPTSTNSSPTHLCYFTANTQSLPQMTLRRRCCLSLRVKNHHSRPRTPSHQASYQPQPQAVRCWVGPARCHP